MNILQWNNVKIVDSAWIHYQNSICPSKRKTRLDQNAHELLNRIWKLRVCLLIVQQKLWWSRQQSWVSYLYSRPGSILARCWDNTCWHNIGLTYGWTQLVVQFAWKRDGQVSNPRLWQWSTPHCKSWSPAWAGMRRPHLVRTRSWAWAWAKLGCHTCTIAAC